jgi:hypothetical protein
MNLDKNQPEKNVPEKEIEAYGLDIPIENRFSEFGIPDSEVNDLLKGKIDISFLKEDTDIIRKRSIIVSGEHLDTNNHVNNAQYVAFATSLLPADFRTSVFRAEYKMQSKLGDEIYPVVKASGIICV